MQRYEWPGYLEALSFKLATQKSSHEPLSKELAETIY